MADLSPAATAVLDAVTLKRWDVPHQACPKSIDQIKSDAAAVLRAIAYCCQVDTEFIGGVEYVRTNKLIALARELETEARSDR